MEPFVKYGNTLFQMLFPSEERKRSTSVIVLSETTLCDLLDVDAMELRRAWLVGR